MKIDISEVESVLLKKKVENVPAIVKELNAIVEELKNEPKDEKIKWEHVIVLLDKDGVLKDKEIAGWVVQQHENEDAGTILSRISVAARDQNESAKRKKNLITTMVELFDSLKPKFVVKDRGDAAVRIKTKELTRVIITDGKLV
jgi:hypothetical protein